MKEEKRQRAFNRLTAVVVAVMVVAAVLAAGVFRGTGPFAAGQAAGGGEVVAASVVGNVDVERAGVAMELLEGTRCREGDVVWVRTGSQVVLAIGDAGTVVLPESTRATVRANGQVEVLPLDTGAAGGIATAAGDASGSSGTAASAASDPNAATCTVEVRCDTVFAHEGDLRKGVSKYVPADGTVLARREVALQEGDSAFDVLKRACDEAGVQLEFSYIPAYDSYYVEGIGNLYERDCGQMSGWMYRVDGAFPNVGASEYKLAPGQAVEWVFSCDMQDFDSAEMPSKGEMATR